MFLRSVPQNLNAVMLPSPEGLAGVLRTVSLMRALVREGRVDPTVRATAVNLTLLVPERDSLSEIRVLFEFVRDRIRYVSDVHETETLHAAAQVLSMGAGDCDDKSILLAALLESIGYQTRFVVTAHNAPGVYDHVYLTVVLPDGSIMPLDESEPQPLGWEPPLPLSMMFEPL